jgi:hypothetical protein
MVSNDVTVEGLGVMNRAGLHSCLTVVAGFMENLREIFLKKKIREIFWVGQANWGY